jgi:putative drug exporter of the RND superfamily
LLFDTLIVRSFMTPALAALLGKWFWWPKIIRQQASERRLAAIGIEPARADR